VFAAALRVTMIDAEEDWPATWGQPWKDTTALASTNRIAAPASSEPAVPNPARYALVARTVVTYRQLPPNG
jgi:hypothetical protein